MDVVFCMLEALFQCAIQNTKTMFRLNLMNMQIYIEQWSVGTTVHIKEANVPVYTLPGTSHLDNSD